MKNSQDFVDIAVLFLPLGAGLGLISSFTKNLFLLWLQHSDVKLCPFSKISAHEFSLAVLKTFFFLR